MTPGIFPVNQHKFPTTETHVVEDLPGPFGVLPGHRQGTFSQRFFWRYRTSCIGMIPSIRTLPQNSGVHQVQFCFKLPLPSAAKCLFYLNILQESNGFHPPALICHRWHRAVEGHDVRPGVQLQVPKNAWNHDDIGRKLVVLWFQFLNKKLMALFWMKHDMNLVMILRVKTFNQLGSTDVPWLGDGTVFWTYPNNNSLVSAVSRLIRWVDKEPMGSR